MDPNEAPRFHELLERSSHLLSQSADSLPSIECLDRYQGSLLYGALLSRGYDARRLQIRTPLSPNASADEWARNSLPYFPPTPGQIKRAAARIRRAMQSMERENPGRPGAGPNAESRR